MELETTGMVIRMIGALALILGILMLVFYGVRRWGERFHGGKDDPIQIIATRMILPKKHLCLVRVGGMTLVLGAADNSISLLGTLNQGSFPGTLREEMKDEN
jgi:flagellar biosynthetic protein FliO